MSKRFFSIFIISFFLFLTSHFTYAVDQEVIKAKVLEVVESKQDELEVGNEEIEAERDSSTSLEMTTHSAERETHIEVPEDRVLWSGLGGVAQVRRVGGQWYFSLRL